MDEQEKNRGGKEEFLIYREIKLGEGEIPASHRSHSEPSQY